MKKYIFLVSLLTVLSSCNQNKNAENTDTTNDSTPTSAEFQYPEEHITTLDGNCPCPYCSGTIDVKDDYLLELL